MGGVLAWQSWGTPFLGGGSSRRASLWGQVGAPPMTSIPVTHLGGLAPRMQRAALGILSAPAPAYPQALDADHTRSTETPPAPPICPRWPGHSPNTGSGRRTQALCWGPKAGQVLPAGGQCTVPVGAWKCRLQSSRQPRSQKLHLRGSPRSHRREATEPMLTASGKKMSHVTNHGPQGPDFY